MRHSWVVLLTISLGCAGDTVEPPGPAVAREAFRPWEVASGIALSVPAGPAAVVDARGARLTLGDVEDARLVAVAVGRADAPVALRAAPPEVSGADVTRRIAAGVIEWWRALPGGLEHGITLEERPAGEGALRIDVRVDGLTLRALRDDAVELRRPHATGGAPLATYAQLTVIDADGAHVPARMRVVDAETVRLEVEDSLARYPLVVDPLVGVEQATLRGAGGAADDLFGTSVALSADGSRAIVGAPEADTSSGPDVGNARVFVRRGESWNLEAILRASDGAADDFFGFAVAISSDGSRALVGAQRDDTVVAVDAGSARVFARTGASWAEEATLFALDAENGDRFGQAVAISADGSRALVGGYHDDTAAGVDAGSARVFVRSGTNWTEEAILLASDPASEDGFGFAVALTSAGDLALVSAPLDDTAAGVDAGSAYVFARRGTDWTEAWQLLPSVAGEEDIFGRSLALSSDGSRALIGAERSTTPSGPTSGSAFVFLLGSTGWTEEARLLTSGWTPSAFFGRAVALSADGRRALIGAFLDSTDRAFGGSARVFTRTSASWSEAGTIFAADAEPNDQFGSSVALDASGGLALVGVPRDDTVAGVDSGSARVLALLSSSGTPCALDAECGSGFCTDGVCCESRCSGGPHDACEACSVEAGAETDGTCGPRPNGSECGDTNLCEGPEICIAGRCERGVVLTCDDGDACTSDACDATSGCSHDPVAGCCNADLDCDDADPCTTDRCSGRGGTCTHTPIATCAADAGSDAGPHSPPGGGCSCRAAGRLGGGPPAWLAVLLFAWGCRRSWRKRRFFR